VLSAIFRAPLTSSILMLELTENHDIVVPLLVAAATSTQAIYLWSEREVKNGASRK
jgi:H+/Cl- antiporter ClcA